MAYYDGHVDVWAEDEEQAEERAISKLQRTAFPDRGRSCWRVVSIERLRRR
jgi:hypothetical protein